MKGVGVKISPIAVCLYILTTILHPISGVSKQKEVIIIGAGVAGATVARQLINDPQERFKVTILEGREERFGGRLWTQREALGALGNDADLGGSLIDGSDQHSALVELIKKFELTLMEMGPLEIRSGEKFECHDQNELAETVQRHLIEKIQSALIERHSEEDFSAQEALDMSSGSNTIADAWWDVVLAGFIEPAFGVSLSNLSASTFQVEKLSAGHGVMEGMEEVVNRLISGWGQESTLIVEMGKVVRQIQVIEKTQKVKVRTTDRKSYAADIVVVAVPLSVLKHGELFFEPPLSVKRRNAIKKTGFGILNKVILRFKEAFWSHESGMFAPTAAVLKSSNPLVTAWMNGYQHTNVASLIGLVTGVRAKTMETLDDDELKVEALKSLELIFGKKLMLNQKVVAIQRSSWSGDPLSGGSVSYFAVGNSHELRKQLFRPVCPSLYFAGEYATLEKAGTIEGAYLSGLDVADQVINGCRDGETVKKEQWKQEL